ncbi:ASCH domain-containing protein [Brumimicrobium mesophilum]|uniref:ASCH domain-containing protein n=1 Tax=Brumimicrobium mesophilum TaxID=392717 RepID=UPI000D14409D|nr:ASCH domain-containing protein [Brumimicrobium mesophilum]
MQKLILHEDIFDALNQGKITTIRKGRRKIELGKLMFESSDEDRQKIVEVVSFYYAKLEDVNTEDLENDGFKDHQDMWEKMQRFYPDIGLEDEVTVVKFSC